MEKTQLDNRFRYYFTCWTLFKAWFIFRKKLMKSSLLRNSYLQINSNLKCCLICTSLQGRCFDTSVTYYICSQTNRKSSSIEKKWSLIEDRSHFSPFTDKSFFQKKKKKLKMKVKRILEINKP